MSDDITAEALPGGIDRTTARPDRPRRLQLLDRLLETLWARDLAPHPTLDPDALIAAGGSLPDRSGWQGRLTILCGDLERSARLSPLGRTLAQGQLAAALRDRARLEALWARHPAILDQPLEPPIVVLGQMRSGTTRVQRLLASDDRLGATSFAESWNPVPIDPGRLWFDDRAWRARLGLLLSRALNPGFAAIHPSAAGTADEQIGWHAISLFGSSFDTQWRVPAFTAAVEEGDAVPVYREFRRILQTVLWLRGDDGRRPTVLKIPHMTQHVDALLAVFPGAKLLRLDRDPVAIVASSASLMRNQMEIQSAAVSPHWIGRETLRRVTLRQARMDAALRHADAPHLRLDYAAMTDDWQGEMQCVYRFLGLPFTATTRAGMVKALRRAEKQPLARHRYELRDFGLTAADVRAAVA